MQTLARRLLEGRIVIGESLDECSSSSLLASEFHVESCRVFDNRLVLPREGSLRGKAMRRQYKERSSLGAAWVQASDPERLVLFRGDAANTCGPSLFIFWQL